MSGENKDILKSWWGALALLIFYLGCGGLLIRSPVNIDWPTAAVWGFYTDIGFKFDQYIARMIFLSVLFSCLTHILLIIVHAIRNGWPELREGNARAILYCFARALLAVGFCIMVAGALGDNISSKTLSPLSKELSVLIGALVLGSVTWLINDFIGAFYNGIIRGFK